MLETPEAEGALGRMKWLGRDLARAATAVGADRLLCLQNGGIGPRATPAVVYIQQSLPFSREAMTRCSHAVQARMRFIQATMFLSARRASSVIVQTHTMKSWLVRAFGIAATKVRVILPNAGHSTTTDSFVPRGKHLLYVGSDAPYKNLAIVATALENLRRDGNLISLRCTLPQEHPLVRRAGWQPLGYLTPEQLADEYRQAGALVMPSLVETVGLPLLEAMREGAPIVAADRPYAREVCEDAALFFDPNDAQDLAKALLKVINDTSITTALSAQGLALTARRAATDPYTELIAAAVR